MVKHFRRPLTALCMAVYLLLIMTSPSVAGMIASVRSGDAGQDRAAELASIQRALETEMVKEKLGAHGFDPSEINSRIASLDDEQIHLLAQASDNLLAGGDGLGVVIAILVIILLVILILKLSGHSVSVR